MNSLSSPLPRSLLNHFTPLTFSLSKHLSLSAHLFIHSINKIFLAWRFYSHKEYVMVITPAVNVKSAHTSVCVCVCVRVPHQREHLTPFLIHLDPFMDRPLRWKQEQTSIPLAATMGDHHHWGDVCTCVSINTVAVCVCVCRRDVMMNMLEPLTNAGCSLVCCCACTVHLGGDL